jgi:hypothetical protein
MVHMRHSACTVHAVCFILYLRKYFFTYSVLFIYITFVFISYKDINLLIESFMEMMVFLSNGKRFYMCSPS